MKDIRKLGRGLAAGALLVALTACDDLLTVQDPSRFTDEDVDLALDAVAKGIEGGLQVSLDQWIIYTNLLSDVWQHTGTWIQYDDTDHGRIDYETNRYSGSGFLSLRFEANDAIDRFERIAAGGGDVSDDLRAQVLVSEGWMDLIAGMTQCEDPLGQGTAASPYTAMLAQARDKLTDALTVASGDFELWARAGIARAEVLLGNYSAADAAAAAVLGAAPAGWEKLAKYQVTIQDNSVVQLDTWGFNHAAGMREKWWFLVDDAELQMMDPLTSELDSRVPIRHEAGVLGVDGTTEYYSQWKYTDPGDDIPMTHLDEMTLIRAEAAMETGNPAGALAMLNGLRAAVGLSPAPNAMFADPADPTRDEVFEVLMNERFAEMFMEGGRMFDLHRFGLTAGFMAGTGPGRAGFPAGVGDFMETEPVRPTLFPMSQNEAIENPNIEDDVSKRCVPRTSDY
jgi:hypothetical protein